MSILGRKSSNTSTPSRDITPSISKHSGGGILAKSGQETKVREQKSTFARLNAKDEWSYNAEKAAGLQRNADRADINLSPAASGNVRKNIATVTKKDPLYRRIADKTGITKDLGHLANAAGSVLNAPGDLIRGITKHSDDINNALYNNKLFKMLPKGPGGDKIFADGKTVGEHLQKLRRQTDIPGVTTGPAANYVRGFADTLDFGTGRALDEAFGNTDYLAGRETKAAKAGEITAMVLPTAGAARAIGKSILRKGANSVKNTLEGIQGRQMGAVSESLRKEMPSKLSSPGSLKQLDQAMTKIKPIVTEHMTPPLENPAELAKWIQKYSGIENLSLNEIRKMPYEDMRQLAEEIRPTLNTATEAHKAASALGYDLPALLDGKGNTIAQRVSRQASERAYGIYPEQLPNVRRPLVSGALKSGIDEAVAAGAQKQPLFTKLFGEQGVGITPMGSTKSNRMVTTEQQIVNNPLKTNLKGAWDTVKQTGRSTFQNTVDYLSPLRSINQETYNAAMDSHRANNLANTIVHDKFVDNQGNVIGDSLNDIMKQARGLGKKFDDYLILRHAETRMKRNERVYDESLNMTPELAKQKVMDMEARYPELKQAGDMWDNFHGNILDSAVQEGLLSQAARDSMRTENPHYASMRRQFTIGEKLAQPKFGQGGSSFSGQSAPIKAVSPTGSTRKIVSPIRSAVEQTQAWKTAELRNRTMQEIVTAIQQNPEGMGGIAEIVKKPSTSYQSLDNALRQGGSEEFLQQLDSDYKSLFKPTKTGEENVVRAMVNGNPVYVRVKNPEAVKALLGMGQESSGYILGAFQKLSNATKRGATGLLAPMFAVKNLTADVVQGAIQSPNAIKHVAIDLPHALISSLGDVFHIPGMKNLAEEFRRAGGEYSSLLRGDRALNKSVSSLRKEAPLSMRGLIKGAGIAAKAPFKALEKVSDITENVNRMAAYRRDLVGKERTPENVRNAINAARESTTNFSRRGALARETEAFIPYNNAAIQSIYRLGKAFSDPKTAIKTVAGIGTLIVAPKLREYALYHNDPDYQKLPARERYRNIILSKNADGTFNKQPMPPEYEAIGGVFTDVLRRVIDQNPGAFKGSLDALANAYTPPWMSGTLQGYTQGGGPEQSLKGASNATVFAPIQAIIGNQSFTGAPIVSQRLQGNSPAQQYDERTSKPAKVIGDKIGLSPIKVDYLLRAYGGDPSRLILPLMSDVGGGTPRNTLLKNFIVDPVFTNTLSNDFYNMKQKITQVESDNNTNAVEFPSWYKKDVADYVTNQRKGGLSKTLSGLNTQKRDIQADKTLSAQDKAQKLRDIQSKVNQLYLDAISKMKDGGVPGLQKW